MPLWTDEWVLLFVSFCGVVDLFSDEFQLLIGVFLKCPVEAGLIADMALAGIYGDFENQTILIAVDEYLFHPLEMAALLALLPQFPAGPAKIGREARLDGFLQGLMVHMSHHEDLARPGILSNGRYQTVFTESWCKFQTFFDVLFCGHPFCSFRSYSDSTIFFAVYSTLPACILPGIICENKLFRAGRVGCLS